MGIARDIQLVKLEKIRYSNIPKWAEKIEKYLSEGKLNNIIDVGDNKKIDVIPYIAIWNGVFNTDQNEMLVDAIVEELGINAIASGKYIKNIDNDDISLLMSCPLGMDYAYKRFLNMSALRTNHKSAALSISLALYLLLVDMKSNFWSSKHPKADEINTLNFAYAIVNWWLRQNKLTEKLGIASLYSNDRTLEGMVRDEIMGENSKENWISMLRGEITYKELIKKENTYKDDFKLNGKEECVQITQEAWNVYTYTSDDTKNLRYKDIEPIELRESIYRLIQENAIQYTYRVGKQLLECIVGMYLNSDRISEREKIVDNLNKTIDDIKGKNEKLKESRKELTRELQNIKYERDEVVNKLRLLENNSKDKGNSDNDKYIDEISSLKLEVQKFKKLSKRSETMNNELRSNNSKLKRELKRSNSDKNILKRKMLDLENELKLRPYNDGSINNDLPLDFCISQIKNERIVIIGGKDNLNSIFKNAGFSRLKHFNEESPIYNLDIENYDYVTIITGRTPHSGIGAVKEFCKNRGIKLIYFNGNSVTNLIKLLHEEIMGDEVKNGVV